MVLLVSKSTNHVACTLSHISLAISHIRSRRHVPTSSNSNWDSWDIEPTVKLACGRCAVKADGERYVKRSVRLDKRPTKKTKARSQNAIQHTDTFRTYRSSIRIDASPPTFWGMSACESIATSLSPLSPTGLSQSLVGMLAARSPRTILRTSPCTREQNTRY